MGMRKTKGFSYDPIKDKDIIDFLDKQPNFSQYLKDLVRKDMKGSDIVEIVNRQIEKYLQKYDYSKITNSNYSMDINIDNINSILNI